MNKIKDLSKIFIFSLKLILNINNFQLFIMFILNFLNAIIPFISIALTGMLINNLTKTTNLKHILFIFLLICLIQVLKILGETFYSYYLIKFQTNLTLKIENEIINKAIKLQYRCFEDSNTYDELRRASTDSAVQPYSLLVTILSLTRNLIQIISAIGILSLSNIKDMYLLLIIPVLIIIPNLKVINKEHSFIKSISKEYRKQNYYRNLLTNNEFIKEIKLYNLGKKFASAFNTIGIKINKKSLKMYREKNIINIFINLAILFIVCFIQYECLKNTLNGLSTVGELVVYFQTISKVESIISDIMTTSFSLYQITLFIEHLYNFLNIDLEEKYNLGLDIDSFIRHKNNKITFNNVSFKYPNNINKTLKDVNFEVNQGEIVSIVGKNGSGKSTLLNLLSRLYDENDGQILYNNIPIKDIDIIKWRNELKITIQDFIKYEFSLKENIAIADNEDIINQSKINKIIELIKLNSFIDKLPNGVNSQLGVKFNHGSQVSQGEWQKVAIARSLYKTGRILFWDEPSSALDSDTEEIIFSVIKYLIDIKEIDFAFFITHNYNNLKYADKILYINDGKCITFEDYEDFNIILNINQSNQLCKEMNHL